ncbi:hypothetical protein [Rhodococcus opacus]|nr:hypothetical protein [Rhodococcus opacus]
MVTPLVKQFSQHVCEFVDLGHNLPVLVVGVRVNDDFDLAAAAHQSAA